jgi:hypothetical protein
MTYLSAELSDLAAMAALAPLLAQAFVSLACDIALVLDPQGIITYVAHSETGSLIPIGAVWIGSRWTETVTLETRSKIEGLLTDVAASGRAQRREVTLSSTAGATIPVSYAALRLGPAGPTLAVGRDLRAAASLQERFLKAQRELEQGYRVALGAAEKVAPVRHAGGQALAARAMVSLVPAAAELLGLGGADRREGGRVGVRRSALAGAQARAAAPGARSGGRRSHRRG